MSRKPPAAPHCPRCLSTDLDLKKHVVGEKEYRRVITSVVCKTEGCDWEKDIP